jgi:hypothetical protein
MPLAAGHFEVLATIALVDHAVAERAYSLTQRIWEWLVFSGGWRSDCVSAHVVHH